MARRFEVGKPVVTTTPTVTVRAGLPSGRHTFRLVVETGDGRRSRPTEVVVTVAPAPPKPRG